MISSDLIEHDANCAIQELKFDEIDSVFGGTDRGTAGAAGAITGAATAASIMTAARFASYGARIGVVGGIGGLGVFQIDGMADLFDAGVGWV